MALSIELKPLRSQKGFDVYYVRTAQKVSLASQNGPVKIYQEGLNAYVESCDFEKYNSFFSKYGYPPSSADIGKIIPNHESIKPGIEIMLSRKLFSGGLNGFYSIMDKLGLDSNSFLQKTNPEFRTNLKRNRANAREKVDRFLSYLYEPLNHDNVKEYELRLTNSINSLENPNDLFDLHILGARKARWTNFNYLNLEEALAKDVRINIDWGIASKMLGLLH